MMQELNEHLEALRRWIDRQGDIPTLALVLSADERKQLQAVNKTIVQLTRLGVSVPEDLRNLKLRLSTKDASDTANRDVEEGIEKVEALIEQLRKLLQAARSLRDRLKATGQTAGTKKHYGVTLLELLQSGHLSTEDRLELQWLKDGPTYEGKVQPDGSVMAKTLTGWKHYASLSAAADDIAERSLNGWEHWRRINSDGSRTSLKEIRSRFMSKGPDL
jgi:DNA-binding ferritin-like protein